jgi:peptidoglycan/LPS O-acetylase OafA/YrhL
VSQPSPSSPSSTASPPQHESGQHPRCQSTKEIYDSCISCVTNLQEKSANDLPALTGVRGFAAVLVVLHHLDEEWTTLFPSWATMRPITEKGGYAVDFFFLLSGFILCHAQSSKGRNFGVKEYKSFLWLRIARVYPVHLITLLALIAMVFTARFAGVRMEGDYPIGGLPAHLSMTHYFPFVEAGQWNYPSWSISAEWFAYLFVFPVGWWLLQKTLRPLPLLAGSALLMFVWSCAHHFEQNPSSTLGVIRVICGFLAGTLLYGIYRQSALVLTTISNLAVFWAITTSALAFFLTDGFLCHAIILIICFPALLLSLSQKSNSLSRFFSTKAMVWLGSISYGLYMSHGIVEKILKVIVNPDKFAASSLAVRSGVLALNVTAILAAAIFLYYCVETPCRLWLRGFRWRKQNWPQ